VIAQRFDDPKSFDPPWSLLDPGFLIEEPGLFVELGDDELLVDEDPLFEPLMPPRSDESSTFSSPM
jgi:hypothetical protein